MLPFGAVILAFACGGDDATPDAAADAGPDADVSPLAEGGRRPYDSGEAANVARVPVAAELVSSDVDVQGMMFAAGEMQIGGEPFAQLSAGRNLAYYDRLQLPPDQYLVANSAGGTVVAVTDLFGFSTAVESYEYSKYHVNSIIQFSGAGVSLANGPIVARMPQATAQERLIARAVALMTAAGTDVGGLAVLPPPQNNPLNLIGFAGLVPVFAPYSSFAPDVPGTTALVQSCDRRGGYSGLPAGLAVAAAYECEYNELHVPDAKLNHVLVPAALGLATWKQALWAIDFAGRLHDVLSSPVDEVAAADRPDVGKASNRVRATAPAGAVQGTYIGSSPLEGMWGLVMIEGMDNLDEWLLGSLTTNDGVALGGFASTSEAINYDYSSPLRWFPAATTVAVDPSVPYPPVTSLTLTDPASRSVDLASLLLGNAMFFAMTDARNAGIGQSLGLQMVFDGDPFPADNGLPDGEATAHDRALGVMRVAFVNLERMHADPALGIILDGATVNGGVVSQGTTVTTTALAHVLIGLRQTILSLNAAVTQYGSADEDPSGDAQGILNSIAIHPPGGGTPAFSAHARAVFVKNATFVRDVLTTGDGRVVNGATIAAGKATPTTDAASLESQTAAVRALTEAFLLTGDESFRTRARAVSRHLQDGFYSAAARMYRGREGGNDEVHMTPQRFGWLQSALRETHKTLFVPGDAALDRSVLEDRIARVNKLFMNGWDDLNGDQKVDVKTECLGARLQSAEQSLTGDLGHIDGTPLPVSDRDKDCVPVLSSAKKLSVFAGDVYFHTR